jgi:hypothetical protein
MDFGKIFNLEQTITNDEAGYEVTSEQEGAVEHWEEELRIFLAGVEPESDPTMFDKDWSLYQGGRQQVGVEY